MGWDSLKTLKSRVLVSIDAWEGAVINACEIYGYFEIQGCCIKFIVNSLVVIPLS